MHIKCLEIAHLETNKILLVKSRIEQTFIVILIKLFVFYWILLMQIDTSKLNTIGLIQAKFTRTNQGRYSVLSLARFDSVFGQKSRKT